jgi:hypothetical protein
MTPYDIEGWHPVTTIPLDRVVEVKSVRGVICKAKIAYPTLGRHIVPPTRRVPFYRVHCFRADKSSDISAIAWRDLPPTRLN